MPTPESVRAGTLSSFKVRYGPAGVHLFARSTGLNVLLDEVTPPEAKWSRAPRSVSIALTNTCDLECSYCYAPKHRAMLDDARILAWCAELDEHGCFGIGFGGGEPTLFPRLAKICAEIERTTSLAISMTTHGHRFTPEYGRALAGHLHFVRVSVDGVGSTYERLRGRPFGVLRERLAVVRDTAAFGINCVVNADTVDDLDALATFADEVGAKEILLLPEHVDGIPAIAPDVQAKMAAWVDRHFGTRRISVSNVGADLVESPTLPIGERPERDYGHIDADGVAKRCSFDRRGIAIESGVVEAFEALRGMKAPTLLRRTR